MKGMICVMKCSMGHAAGQANPAFHVKPRAPVCIFPNLHNIKRIAMKKHFWLLLIASLLTISACTQTGAGSNNNDARVGGPCEGCEAIYECPTPLEELDFMVNLPDWDETKPRIAINGIVYQADGVTPAPGVIIYIYHTDQTGVYPKKGDEKGWGKRHGYLRGWMKTNEKGEYKFFTRRPASYPNSNEPAHIHCIVKEPGKEPYYIDDYLFDDDPRLTEERRNKLQQRGGNGVNHHTFTQKNKSCRHSS